jgi:hypothetical protein
MWKGAIVPIAILSLFGMRKNLLLGLVAITIIATHMLFAHKEVRFVFPAIPFLIILVGIGSAEVFTYIEKDIKNANLSAYRTQKLVSMARVGVVLGWVIISGLVGSSYNFRQTWFRMVDEIDAFQFLYAKSDLCGVGLLDYNLGMAGYTNLHRNVPITIIPAQNIATSFPAYNYALANPEKLPDNWPYVRVRCWSADDKVCVYRRNGPCERAPAIEMNEVRRRWGL